MVLLKAVNNDIFYFFYNLAHQAEWLDQLIVFLAAYLPFVVVFGAAWYLIFNRRSFKKFFYVFFSGGVAYLVSEFALKIFFHAPRPPVVLHGIYPLIEKTSYSFPSGHAAVFMALAVAMFFVEKKSGLWFLLFALIIGIARVAAGVHFPVDILGGFALGTVVAYLLKKI